MLRLNVGPKISLGFASLIVLSIIIAGTAYVAMQSIFTATQEQTDTSLPLQQYVLQVNLRAKDTTINTLRFVAYFKDEYMEELRNNMRQINDLMTAVSRINEQNPEATSVVMDELREFAALQPQWTELQTNFEQAYRQSRAELDDAVAAVNSAQATAERYVENQRKQQFDEMAANSAMPVLQRRIDRIGLAQRIVTNIKDAQASIWETQATKAFAPLEQVRKIIQQDISAVEALLKDTLVQANIDELNSLIGALRNLNGVVADYITSCELREQLLVDLGNINQRINTLLTSATSDVVGYVIDGNNDSVNTISDSQRIIMLATLVALIMAVFVAFRITRMITRPIAEMSGAFDSLVNRDFQIDFSPAIIGRQDEMGRMVRDFENVCDVLSETINDLRESSENVAVAAAQINQGNQDLSNRTQQQASAVEETASALEEMTSSVKNTASNAQAASGLADLARKSATQGGEVTARTVKAMQDVTDSSRKINDIIDVVNEIAFQTNLLALNAAVEAARAGDAGRGFAVVAGEVRGLAGRSADAAKQIQVLISDSVRKIEQGNEMVHESGTLLDEIITNVQQVADTIEEMNGATQEQATGIDEINKAMGQMDQGIQRNAALVEQISAAADSLSSSAAMALNKVRQFHTRNGNGQTRKALPEA